MSDFGNGSNSRDIQLRGSVQSLDLAEEYSSVMVATKEINTLQRVLEREIKPKKGVANVYYRILEFAFPYFGIKCRKENPAEILNKQLDMMDGLSQSLERMAFSSKQIADSLSEQFKDVLSMEDRNIGRCKELIEELQKIEPIEEHKKLEELSTNRAEPDNTSSILGHMENLRRYRYCQGEYNSRIVRGKWLVLEQKARATYTELMDYIAISMAEMKDSVEQSIETARTTKDVYLAFRNGKLGIDAVYSSLSVLQQHVQKQQEFIKQTSVEIAERTTDYRSIPESLAIGNKLEGQLHKLGRAALQTDSQSESVILQRYLGSRTLEAGNLNVGNLEAGNGE